MPNLLKNDEKVSKDVSLVCTSCHWEGPVSQAKPDGEYLRCPQVFGKRACNRRLRVIGDTAKVPVKSKMLQEQPVPVNTPAKK